MQLKLPNLILWILIAAVVIFGLGFFGINRNLKKSLDKLNDASDSLKAAKAEINNARGLIKDISGQLTNLQQYVNQTSTDVNRANYEKQLNDIKYQIAKGNMKADIKEIKAKLDSLGELPDITVYDTN